MAEPTIHEGVVARALEAKGIIADRCEINRIIKAENRLLAENKKSDVPKQQPSDNHQHVNVIEKWESIRDELIFTQYRLALHQQRRESIEAFLSQKEPDMARYRAKRNELTVLKSKRKALRNELVNLGMLHPIQAGKLNKKIAEITEEMEDVISERNMLLTKLDCADVKEAKALEKQIVSAHDTRNAILTKTPQLRNRIEQLCA
ncbi:MAG: hypothetical protein Q4C54_05930 [Clostridia bacterium]|nr:hypothetical protein [Clostridia bacterium]